MSKKYVLITAAKNEQDNIDKTIMSVISQTNSPVKWIILNDGSTDDTEKIIKKYIMCVDYIELINIDNNTCRNFGAKGRAVQLGRQKLKDTDFDYIGIVDADISFNSTYIEDLLNKFEKDVKLGVAGGIRYDLHNDKFIKVLCANNSVGGPFQMFRRNCFDIIDGYRPLKFGGLDTVAETMARMYGWKVESFSDLRINHYRPTGSATGNFISSRFRYGIKFYVIGYHPLFMVLMLLRRCFLTKNSVLNGWVVIIGYFYAALSKHEREVPKEFVDFLRKEQISRLKHYLRMCFKYQVKLDYPMNK